MIYKIEVIHKSVRQGMTRGDHYLFDLNRIETHLFESDTDHRDSVKEQFYRQIGGVGYLKHSIRIIEIYDKDCEAGMLAAPSNMIVENEDF